MVQNITNEIILTLLKGNHHLREIARILNESHSTLSRKIKELVKDNILDYRKEGKNKVFFIKNNLNAKNYVYSAEIYKLSKLLKKHPKFSITLEDIKKTSVKGMVLLFGSFAKGNPKKDSDIDIYIETTDNSIKYQVQELNSKIKVKIGKFDMNSLLIKEIVKNHILVRGVEEFYEKTKFFEQT